MSAVFFTDRDLGIKFPQILRDAGLAVERHADTSLITVRMTCGSAQWQSMAGSLTHDGRIRYKPNELAAIITHKVRLLVIIGKAPYADLARSFVATLISVQEFLDAHNPPLIGKVYRPSAADLLKNPGTAGRVEL